MDTSTMMSMTRLTPRHPDAVPALDAPAFRRPISRRTFLAGAGATALSLAILKTASAQDGEDITAQMAIPFRTTTDLNLREAPSTTARVLKVMPSGAYVTGGETIQAGFRRVSYQGTLGWAFDEYLSETNGGSFDPGPVVGVRLTTARVNFRTGPTQLHEVIVVLDEATRLEVSAVTDGGYRFAWLPSERFPDQRQAGWVADAYLKAETTTPPPPPPAGSPVRVLASLNLRSGPSTSASVLLVMPEGATATWSGSSQAGFLQVTYGSTTGWAFAEYLQVASGPVQGDGRTTAALNQREQPNLSARVLMVMPEGAEIRLGDQFSNGFRSVTYQGTSGWASTEYIRVA
ncbi:MAG: SH3 domain-containing protein [Thermomicrobiales bacterium]